MHKWARARGMLVVAALASIATAAASKADDNGGLSDAVGAAGESMTQFTQFHSRGGAPSLQQRPQDATSLDNRFLSDAQQKIQTLLDQYRLEDTIRFAYTNPQVANYAVAAVRRFAGASLSNLIVDPDDVRRVLEDADRAVNPEGRAPDNAKAYSDAIHAVRAFRDVATGELRGS